MALAHLARQPQDRLLGGAELFHALDHLLPYLTRTPSVFTLYDLTYRVQPATHNTLNRLYLTLLMPTFLRRANAVIAISESTRRDALRVYGLDPSRVTVVYGGVDPGFCPTPPVARAALRQKYALPERFILSVGTIEPRKILTALLDAYHALRQSDPDLGLVIAGRRGWRSAGFSNGCRRWGWKPRCACSAQSPMLICRRSMARRRSSLIPHSTRALAFPHWRQWLAARLSL